MFTRLRGLWFKGRPIEQLWPQLEYRRFDVEPCPRAGPVGRLRRGEGVLQRGAAPHRREPGVLPGCARASRRAGRRRPPVDGPPRRRPRGVGGGARAHPSDRASAQARGQPRRADADHRRRPGARRHLRGFLVPRPLPRHSDAHGLRGGADRPGSPRGPAAGAARRGLPPCPERGARCSLDEFPELPGTHPTSAWYTSTLSVASSSASSSETVATASDGVSQHQLNDVQRAAVEALQADGIAIVPFVDLFGEELWNDALADITPFIRETEDATREVGQRPAGKEEVIVRRFFDKAGEKEKPRSRSTAPGSDRDLRCPDRHRPRLSASPTRLFYLDNWFTVPYPGAGDRVASQRWHRDPEDEHIVKVFVYFSDVDDEAGPFEYVRGSTTGGRYGDLWPWSDGHRYPPSDELEAAVAPEDRSWSRGRPGRSSSAIPAASTAAASPGRSPGSSRSRPTCGLTARRGSAVSRSTSRAARASSSPRSSQRSRRSVFAEPTLDDVQRAALDALRRDGIASSTPEASSGTSSGTRRSPTSSPSSARRSRQSATSATSPQARTR